MAQSTKIFEYVGKTLTECLYPVVDKAIKNFCYYHIHYTCQETPKAIDEEEVNVI